jgi:hypothetical protein
MIGYVLIIGSIMLILDGIGSIFLQANSHDFWLDIERGFRTFGGFLLLILGIYFVKM